MLIVYRPVGDPLAFGIVAIVVTVRVLPLADTTIPTG